MSLFEDRVLNDEPGIIMKPHDQNQQFVSLSLNMQHPLSAKDITNNSRTLGFSKPFSNSSKLCIFLGLFSAMDYYTFDALVNM